MTQEQVKQLNLGIAPINERTILLVESALHWVLDNTSLQFDVNKDEDLKALHPNVRLFVVKYIDVMAMTGGVTSESIEGLSQSFDSSRKGDLLEQYAEELLSKWLKGRVRFVTAVKRW